MDLDDLRGQSRELWQRKATFWDDRTREANKFQRLLKGPTTERLMDVSPGERILDIACGSGVLARRFAELGGRVIAFDFIDEFVERARARAAQDGQDIDYRVLDATDENAMLSLGPGSFDAAVCGMALMDMPTVEPVARAVAALLRPGGRFVFSVCHPSFNHALATRTVEFDERLDGGHDTVHALKLTGYATPFVQRNMGIAGSPEGHLMFHRPLSELLGPFFEVGLALDALAEPTLPEPNEHNLLSWSNYPQFPPLLLARLRLPHRKL
jgi:SAM-dependent methyltransferase